MGRKDRERNINGREPHQSVASHTHHNRGREPATQGTGIILLTTQVTFPHLIFPKAPPSTPGMGNHFSARARIELETLQFTS